MAKQVNSNLVKSYVLNSISFVPNDIEDEITFDEAVEFLERAGEEASRELMLEMFKSITEQLRVLTIKLELLDAKMRELENPTIITTPGIAPNAGGYGISYTDTIKYINNAHSIQT